ncbi:MAG: HAMP domain-containing histidine kinase [Gemmatimonadaceae bacterium]|nr:HAMP domain-containing histidine kinase [Chitinophagaceae bacterium]
MKRILPIIILLISASLIGIIIIQVQWIQSMLTIKEDQLANKVITSMQQVGDDLMAQKGALPNLKNPKFKPGLMLPSDQLLNELMRPSTIAKNYTVFEIEEKLRKAFDLNGIKDTKFEFAITSSVGLYPYELKSKNFLKELEDTSANRNFVYFLQVPAGSDYESLVPEERMMLVVPNVKKIVFSQLRWMIGGAILFTLILLTAFYVTLSALLRQKKLSEIKNDFINNMTHEFKTPLATISLAVDALRNEKVLQDKGKMDYFSGVIKEENKRMNKQVETILQAALMERQEIQLNKKPVHVHDVLSGVMENFNLQLNEKVARAEVNLQAKKDIVEVDEVHFANLLSNLVDNAIKYSGENLVIKVSTLSSAKYITIRIDDNGIGMGKETQKRIFEKFYRAHTGNLHNVKGFGLGLSYVKTMVDAHGGKIRVDSTLGKGTSFIIDMPLSRQAVIA